MLLVLFSDEDYLVGGVVAMCGIDLFQAVKYYQHIMDCQLPKPITEKEIKYLQLWSLITPLESRLQIDYRELPQTFREWISVSVKPYKGDDAFNSLNHTVIFSHEVEDYDWTIEHISGCHEIIFKKPLFHQDDTEEIKNKKLQVFFGKMVSIYNRVIRALGKWWHRFLRILDRLYPTVDGQIRICSFHKAITDTADSLGMDDNVDYWTERLNVTFIPPVSIITAQALSFQLNMKNEDYVTYTGVHFTLMVIDKRIQAGNHGKPSHSGMYHFSNKNLMMIFE